MYKLICEVSNVVTPESLPVSGEPDTLYAIRKPNMTTWKHEVKVESLYIWNSDMYDWKYLCDRLIYTNERADIIDSPVYYEPGVEMLEDVLYMIKTKYDRSTDPNYKDIVDMIQLKVFSKTEGFVDLNNMVLFSDAEPVHIPVINDISVDDDGEFTSFEAIGEFIPVDAEANWTFTFDDVDTVTMSGIGSLISFNSENTEKYREAVKVSAAVNIEGVQYSKYVKTEPTPTVITNITADDSGENVILTLEGQGITESTHTTWTVTVDDNIPMVIESTGFDVTLDSEKTTMYNNGYLVTASVTANDVTSETFTVKDEPVPVVTEITNITADDSGENVVLTLEATGIDVDTPVSYVITMDDSEGILEDGEGLTLEFTAPLSEAYRSATTVKVVAEANGVTSDEFTVKEPVPEPTVISNITADDSGEQVVLTMTATGVTEEDTAYWTVTIDEQDGVAVEGTGTSVTLTQELSDDYKAGSTVIAQVTVNDVTSEAFTVKEPVPEPIVISNITADDSGENVILTMTATGVEETDTAYWTVTIDEQDGIAVEGTGTVVELDSSLSADYKAGSTVTAQVTVNDVTSEAFTVKEPVPVTVEVTNITADDSGENVVINLEGTGIEEDTEVGYTITFSDGSETTQVTVNGTGTSVELDETNSESYVNSMTVTVYVAIDEYTSSEFTIKEPKEAEGE